MYWRCHNFNWWSEVGITFTAIPIIKVFCWSCKLMYKGSSVGPKRRTTTKHFLILLRTRYSWSWRSKDKVFWGRNRILIIDWRVRLWSLVSCVCYYLIQSDLQVCKGMLRRRGEKWCIISGTNQTCFLRVFSSFAWKRASIHCRSWKRSILSWTAWTQWSSPIKLGIPCLLHQFIQHLFASTKPR